MEQAFPCSVSLHTKRQQTQKECFFACKTKTRAEIPYQKFVTELLGMEEGTQHDFQFSRRSTTKKEQKQLLTTKETQRDGYGDDIRGQILSCISTKQSVFFFANFVLLVQIGPNLLFSEKNFAKVLDIIKLERISPGNLSYLRRFHQYATLNVYSNSKVSVISMVSDSITIFSSRQQAPAHNSCTGIQHPPLIIYNFC